MVLLFWLVPLVIALTPLRNVVLDALNRNEQWRPTAEGMSLSWFAPFSMTELHLESVDGPSRVSVRSIVAEKPLWRLLWDGPSLGRFAVEGPRVDLTLGDIGRGDVRRGNIGGGDVRREGDRSAQRATLTATVAGAGLTMRTEAADEPFVEISGLNLTARIESSNGGRTLLVEPTRLFDQVDLTPETCDRGLYLVAPILARATHVEGRFSLTLEELSVPLGVDPQERAAGAKVSGRLYLHRVEVGTKNPLLSEVVSLIARILGGPAPATIRVTDDAEVVFHLAGDRIHHDGLSFGLPTVSEDLVFRTSGSVGVDESLDLTVDVPLAGEFFQGVPIARRLAGKKLRLAITGTLDDPRVDLLEGAFGLQDLLLDITDSDADKLAELEQVAESVLDIVEDMVQGRRDAKRDLERGKPDNKPSKRGRPFGRLLERLRKSRKRQSETDKVRP